MLHSGENFIGKIAILGSGNVATHLARAFMQSGIEVAQIFSPTAEHARVLAEKVGCHYTSEISDLIDTDLYLFAISDSAIVPVLQQRDWSNKLCVHTAGSVPADVFTPFTQTYGVLYPFQTFTKDVEIALAQVPFFIEASDEKTEKLLLQLAGKISSDVRRATSQQRLGLHLAGVFACNFVNHMMAIAEKILNQNNLSVDTLRPLLSETFRKAMYFGAESVQTGPAIRNNKEIIEKHIELLKENPEWQKIYTFVSESIYKMYHS